MTTATTFFSAKMTLVHVRTLLSIVVVVLVFESKSLFFHESTFRPHETSESDGARFLHRSNPGIKRYAVSKNAWICVYAACVNLLES